MPFSPPRRTARARTAICCGAPTRFADAGCRREGNVLSLPGGKPFEIEFLDATPSLQPHTQPYVQRISGCSVSGRASRIVDAAQYQRRENEYDFDMVSRRYGAALDAGRSAATDLHVRAARDQRHENLAGIADPAATRSSRGRRRQDARELRIACRGPRPGAARRALLGADVVRRSPPARLLGPVSAARPRCRNTIAACRLIWWHDEEKAGASGRQDEPHRGRGSWSAAGDPAGRGIGASRLRHVGVLPQSVIHGGSTPHCSWLPI